MDEFMEKKEWDVFFEVLNMNITESMNKYSEHYRKLMNEKNSICEKHPEYAVLYDYGEERKTKGLNLSNEDVSELSRLIQIEMEITCMMQEMYFFFGYREGFEFAEITKGI